MKKRLWAVLLTICLVAALLPTTALAADSVLQGYCGGDANTEKSATITGTTWVYGVKTSFSTDIYKNVSWRLDKNGTDTYTLTLSGSGKMADYLAGSVRPWNSYASKITKLIVEDGVSSVGSRTCYNFKVLTDISLADTVTDIGEFSFSGCSALVSVDLSNVTSIRANALRDDRALFDIRLSRDLKVIDYQAFCDSGADNSSISIPASVTEIGFGAFEGAKFTNVLNLPNVKKVGAFAFSNSKFAAVVLTNAELEIVSGKVDTSGNEYDNSVFSGNKAVFYTSVPSVMDKLYCDDRMNNIGIIACTNGGSFASEAVFNGFTLAVPQKDGCVFAGWFSDPDLTKTEGLSEENGTYTGTPTTDIHADGRRYYAKWSEIIAEVDGTGYTSLADAVAAADGKTIKLLKDVTENVTIPADKTITLDLNGNDITVNDGCAIVNKGTLTITGSGNVTTSANGSAAVANFPDAAVNLNGGTYSSSSWYVIKNMGGMVIDGPVTVKKPDGSTDTSSLIDNGWVNGSDTVASESVTAQANKAKLTIKNGAFEGKSGSASCSVVKNDNYGVLEITGGTFDSTNNVETSNATTILNWNVATISGGTFKGSYPISNGSYKNEADLGLLTISGGDFIGTSSLFGQAQGGTSGAGKVTITDGSFKAPQFGAFDYAVEISGGTFSFDPSTKVKNNGTDYIVKRAGSEGAYTYTVLAKSGLTSGVYLTDPSGALASNYYVSSTANGVWTVSYSAPYSGGSSSDPTYSVSTPSKTENGSVTVSPKNASKGTTVTINAKPDAGYVLGSLEVKDANGNTLSLTDKGNGKTTFTMPASKVEIKATFVKEVETSPFSDVSTSAYYYEAVKWAQEKGITGGIGNGLFGPNQPCTRAQIVTFLWRAAGSPEPKSMSSFSDVSADSYYAKAVAWAVENGITTGAGDGKFSPDATCTRAQSVTFLYRAMGTAPTTVNGFTDVAADSFCADAVAWAVENGVTNGTSASAFSPSNGCTRAQIVTFLFRAYQGK